MVGQKEGKASVHLKSIPAHCSWALASLTSSPPLVGYGESRSRAVIDPIHRQSSSSEPSSPTTQRKQGLVNFTDNSLGGAWEPQATHVDPGSNTRVEKPPWVCRHPPACQRKGTVGTTRPILMAHTAYQALTHSQLVKMSGKRQPCLEGTLQCFSKGFQSLKIESE